MNIKIEALHSQAMDIADDAFIARRKGLFEQAKQFSKEALHYEKEAALLLINEFSIEPSRSVLFRSAGWLAFNAEEYETARLMVNYALQGHPPSEIKEELNELVEEIEKKKNISIIEDFAGPNSFEVPVASPYFWSEQQDNYVAANDKNYKFALAA